MFPFLFPFQHWRLWQDYGERLSRCIHGTMEEEKKKERKKWNWLVSSAIKSVNRRESIFCIVGFLERIQWRAKFRASDRIDKMDRLKSTCMLFILLRLFFFFLCQFYQISRFNLFIHFFLEYFYLFEGNCVSYKYLNRRWFVAFTYFDHTIRYIEYKFYVDRFKKTKKSFDKNSIRSFRYFREIFCVFIISLVKSDLFILFHFACVSIRNYSFFYHWSLSLND